MAAILANGCFAATARAEHLTRATKRQLIGTDEPPFELSQAYTRIQRLNADWYLDPNSPEAAQGLPASHAAATWYKILAFSPRDAAPSAISEMPTQQVRLKNKVKHIEDRVSSIGSHGSLWLISDRFKKIIELFEIGQHWFFPYRILLPDLTPWHTSYWLFRARTRFETIDVDSSPALEWSCSDPSSPSYRKSIQQINGHLNQIKMYRDKTRKIHVWMDSLSSHFVFFSASICQYIKANQLTGIYLDSRWQTTFSSRENPDDDDG